MPTFRVFRLNEVTEVETEIATGIATKDLARLEIRNDVRSFLNNEYDDERFELRWMPNRRRAFFRKLGSRRVVSWWHEVE